jgi:ADP-ribose pyrophosphatase YjhB (NUDIX family)
MDFLIQYESNYPAGLLPAAKNRYYQVMSKHDPVKYCSHCGDYVSLMVPDGDNRHRHVCNACGQIHYQNPKVVCGCIPVWQDRILMCKRAIEPRKGLWTLPAGFMENGETAQYGAARETLEEACAEIKDQTLYGIYNLPQINQVYIMFLAQLKDENGFAPGEESLEVQLFEEHQIPWQDIAFRVIHLTLERYLMERESGNFSVVVEDII